MSIDPCRYTITLKREINEGELVFKATVKELPDIAIYEQCMEMAYDLAIDSILGLHKMAVEMGHHFPEPGESR